MPTPEPAAPETPLDLVREYLVALAFRFRHATMGAPDDFGSFQAGADVRTPTEIVVHMTGLLRWVVEQYQPADSERGSKKSSPEDFDAECERFLGAVRDLDGVLASIAAAEAVAGSGLAPTSEMSFGQLWRGPLTDAMTHVGQLATLRRLAGSPIDRVRYWQVDMQGFG